MRAKTRSGKSATGREPDTTGRGLPDALVSLPQIYDEQHHWFQDGQHHWYCRDLLCCVVGGIAELHDGQHHWYCGNLLCCRACIDDGGADARTTARQDQDETVRFASRRPQRAVQQIEQTQMLRLRDKRRPFS